MYIARFRRFLGKQELSIGLLQGRNDYRGRRGREEEESREENISAEKTSEKKRARLPEENGNKKRPQSIGQTSRER